MGTDEELTPQQRMNVQTWFEATAESGSMCRECGALVPRAFGKKAVHVRWHERVDRPETSNSDDA